MNSIKRIFVIGHPGAGKGLFAKELAKALGWQFVDADFDLERRIGKSLNNILGETGDHQFHQTERDIFNSLKNRENIVVTTDASVVCDKENVAMLSNEFIVYLKVNTETQMSRMIRNQPFLISSNLENFLNKLHKERDDLYEHAAHFSIDSNDSALEKHVSKTAKIINQKNNCIKPNFLVTEDLVLFHKLTHKPVQLNQKQSECLIHLASGKSSKEIANIMNLSSRTIEDHLEKLMETFGCYPMHTSFDRY